MSKVKFTANKDERYLIWLIVNKIQADYKRIFGRKMNSQTLQCLQMDIEAYHCNDTRLRLDELANSSTFNIAHDVFGIHNNIDRRSGKIRGLFLPRFVKKTTKKSSHVKG